MAKVINSEVKSRLISSDYQLCKIIILGILSGLMFWIFTLLVNKYWIMPFFCKDIPSSHTCLNSVSISGNIAMIFVAFIGIIAMVKLRIYQPLLVATASVISLWGFAGWIDGLSVIEMISCSALVYLLAYILFSWITRFKKIGIVLVIILIIIIAVRITTTL